MIEWERRCHLVRSGPGRVGAELRTYQEEGKRLIDVRSEKPERERERELWCSVAGASMSETKRIDPCDHNS